MYGLHDQNNVLVQKQLHPSDGFVAVPPDAVCGMILDPQSGEYSSPQIPLGELKNRALSMLNANFTRCHVECRGYYDCNEERETWDQQKREAESYIADNQAVTPFMDSFVAANPNMTKAQLAATIIANAAAMSEAAGNLGGQLSAKRAEILEAEDETELNAVDLTFVLPTINLEDK